MKLSTLFVGLFAVSSAFSATTMTYVGKGRGVVNHKIAMEYTSTLKVEVIEKDKAARFTEETKVSNGDVHRDEFTLRIGEHGVVTVENKGVVIGGGYCIPQKDDGKWCNFNAITPGGYQHQNFYKDTANGLLHRMGDLTLPDGQIFWSDTLVLQKP